MSRGRSNQGNSRDDVVRAALHILDEHGLPDLTMRRLASELGVQPSALYWHFPNKQSLLAELAHRIVDRTAGAPDPAAPWVEQVKVEASTLRDALLAYRDAAEIVISTLALGLGASGARERLAAVISAGGFDEATVRRAATILLHFILGHVTFEQQRMTYDSLGARVDEPGAALIDDPSAKDFEVGVDLFVRGLEQQQDAPSSARGHAGAVR